MTPAEILSTELAEAARDLRARDEPFAFATIVRTAGTTAAQAAALTFPCEEASGTLSWPTSNQSIYQ